MNINAEFILNFWIACLNGYLITTVFSSLIFIIKFSNLNPDEYEEYNKFRTSMKKVIINEKLENIVLAKMAISILFPFIPAGINLVLIFVMLSGRGLYSIINAVITAQNFHIIRPIKFKKININK